MLFPEFSNSPSGSYAFNTCIGRGDSMILIFHVPPLARGEGLCDIDTEVFSPEKFRKMSKKLGISGTTELDRRT